MPSHTKALVVGDLHFKNSNILECERFSDYVVGVAEKYKPSFIVLLGDLLHYHGLIHVPAHNILINFIERLSEISETYVIMGNHDLINHSQFLTDNHIFNPLKKWKNVTIVDTPVHKLIKGKEFIFCPYIPQGRIVEALNTLNDQDVLWEIADCIFTHYGFDKEEWEDGYPNVIGGHIHTSQIIEPNIYYIGSAMQESPTESPDKYLWLVDFDTNSSSNYFHSIDESFSYMKLKVPLRGKMTVAVDVTQIKEKIDLEMIEQYDVKIVIEGGKDEIEVFKKSKLFRVMKKKGFVLSFSPSDIVKEKRLKKIQGSTFDDILYNLVDELDDENISAEYEEVTGKKISKSGDENETIENVTIESVHTSDEEDEVGDEVDDEISDDEEAIHTSDDEDEISDEEEDDDESIHTSDDELEEEEGDEESVHTSDDEDEIGDELEEEDDDEESIHTSDEVSEVENNNDC